MKVALVYDRVNKWGGAERVLLTLHEIFPEAPLFTSVYDAKRAPWAKIFPKVISSFLQRVSFAHAKHEYLAHLMPAAFESFNFDGYDLVISVTSEAAKGIITRHPTIHICYCLTPTRYLWSHYDEYFKIAPLKNLAKPVIEYLRNWDKVSAGRPDIFVSISETVKKRIKKYYKRDSKVIYPPLATTLFNAVQGKTPRGKYFLVVSRLVPYKRVDLVIESFNQLKQPLVVIGTGSEGKKLKKMAGKSIKFVGQLTDNKLAAYYRRCRALIFPQEEDFGLVPLEAQLAGKPVVAYAAGGALETVIPDKTGIFFHKQEPKAIITAVRKLEKMRFNPRDAINSAKRFSKERFKKEFLNLINDL